MLKPSSSRERSQGMHLKGSKGEWTRFVVDLYSCSNGEDKMEAWVLEVDNSVRCY